MDARAETARHRVALADGLDGLTDQQWSAPSLCEGWSNKHVLAHLTMPFRMSTPAFLTQMALARGRFHVLADRVARRDAAALPTADLLRSLRQAAVTEKKFPAGGYEGALTHDVVHGLDICRPLGLTLPIEDDALRIVLHTLADPARTSYFGVDLAGARLQASDLDWTHGDGDGDGDEVIAAPARDLILLLTGRTVAGVSLTAPASGEVTP
jgi:uncharacterized protein (TIGR03083 family)